ncbi:Ubiquitin carboxyl-terminal hydrolase 8 [Sphaceloma murrayae]|uniref:Ubiquitin carboxyl-terminal hydrolase 8 n=1 Tax=Sphaceloma murrayae TaxID=2082308 RepID=A0A2K1R2B0_9PEZI|nr:Ubiquitin carboxyl-terminal hydrolase 8 [Sphaceloma murrayae]
MNLPSPPSGGPHHLQPGSERSSARYSNGSTTSGGSSKSNQPLAHIQDLQERALAGLDRNQSISHLITAAENSLRQAVTLLEYRRPDLAYQEYLRCYEILVNYIYQNPGYPTFKNSKGPMYSRHNHLIKRLTSREAQFQSVKEIIENDNKRNGTLPRLPTSLTPGPKSTSPSIVQGSSFSAEPQDIASPPMNGHTIQGLPIRPPKPPVSDKPAELRSRPLSGEGATGNKSPTDVLAERFSRLRMAQTIDTTGRPQSRESQYSPASPQSPVEFRNSFDARNSIKPAGPRSMNGGFYQQEAGPLSIDAQVAAAMPQPPTPAYSPARNMQISGNIELPRSSARSMVGTGGRSNSLASSVATNHGPGGDDSGYFAKPTINGAMTRRKSVYLPRETRIGAEKLYDYLKMHTVLLIDCRGRDEFDQGHIYSSSIICIEPTALRKDMSAEQLQDSLVISPDHEQELFALRDNFDLVVYYDATTSSDQYLRNPTTAEDYSLRYLHEALFEYSEKPLQRPPILLMGGIYAWADLVGNQALKTSNTAEAMRSARPQRRSVVPDAGARLQNFKRRKRDYNPLDAEEEQKWRERARKESVVVEPRPSIQEDDEPAVDESIIDEFNRRFPDAATIGQPVVSEYQDLRKPPRPPKIPEYPAPPPSSSPAPSISQPPPVPPLPTVPRRPAPAAPRMSYSGVNERSVSMTKSAELPAYVPHHLQPSNLRLPRTGLVNFGVTCYMNATIQALSATLPMSLFFLDDKYKGLVQRDNWKGSKGVLPDLFANLVRSIWKGDVEAIRPSTLRAFCARLNREWGIDRQQDAKEFLDFLLDCLHEDLNVNWQRTPLRALTEEQEIEREKQPKLVVSKTEWARYTHREMSYLTSLFAGQHASRLKCTKCHFTSTTYEAFYSISVEIPRSGKSTLQECLRSYCAEEMLSSDEMWKCPRCKKQREATKQIAITRAPQFLVVHFKRFAAGKEGSAKKVRTPIDFPLENLDLEPYMLPQPQSVERDIIVRDFGPEGLKTDASMTPPFLYDAYAVMRHIGTTMSSGHYTCLARDKARRCWRHYNDTLMSDFDPEKVPERERLGNEMAYIVFYERKR